MLDKWQLLLIMLLDYVLKWIHDHDVFNEKSNVYKILPRLLGMFANVFVRLERDSHYL